MRLLIVTALLLTNSCGFVDTIVEKVEEKLPELVAKGLHKGLTEGAKLIGEKAGEAAAEVVKKGKDEQAKALEEVAVASGVSWRKYDANNSGSIDTTEEGKAYVTALLDAKEEGKEIPWTKLLLALLGGIPLGYVAMLKKKWNADTALGAVVTSVESSSDEKLKEVISTKASSLGIWDYLHKAVKRWTT